MSVLGLIFLLISIAILIVGIVDLISKMRFRAYMKSREEELKRLGVTPRLRSGLVYNKETGKFQEDISICPSYYRMLAQKPTTGAARSSSYSFTIGE